MTTIQLIDTHCHLDDTQFDHDRETVLKNCLSQGISEIVVPGISRARWDRTLDICRRYSSLHPALGLHPMFMDEHRQEHIEELTQQLNQHRLIAIGEIGLDFYAGKTQATPQLHFFEQQLDIAASHHLPVLLHVRKAHEETLQLLRKKNLTGGIVHAFSGSYEQAKQYVNLGFKLGFGGTLTYARSHKLHRIARQLPIDAIVLETDAPDMTVSQHRGERNSPEYLPYCLQALSEVRNTPATEIAHATSANAEKIFNFSLKQY